MQPYIAAGQLLLSSSSRRLNFEKGECWYPNRNLLREALYQSWQTPARHVNWPLFIIPPSKYLVELSAGIDLLLDMIVALLSAGMRRNGGTWPHGMWFEHCCHVFLETLHHPLYVRDLVSNHIRYRQKIHRANESACQLPSCSESRSVQSIWWGSLDSTTRYCFLFIWESCLLPPLQGENVEMDLPVPAYGGNTPGKKEYEALFF